MNQAEQLSCQELVELVTDYLERALAPVDLRSFEEHLASCPGCTVYLEQLGRTIELTGRLEPEQLSPEAEQALLEAFRGWRRETASAQ